MKFLLLTLLVEFTFHEPIIPIVINETIGSRTQFKISDNINVYFFQDLQYSYTFFSSDDIIHPISVQKLSDNIYTFPFNEQYKAYLMKDDLTELIINITIKDMHFYYGEKFSPYAPHLGLGYKIHDKKMSIVYQSYEQGIIKNLRFGLKLSGPEEDEYNSFLYLGGVPEEIKINKYSESCIVERNFDTWGCNITSAHFLDEVYYANEYLYFQLDDENFIKGSDNFREFFFKKTKDKRANKEEKKKQNFTLYLNLGEFQIEIKKFITIVGPNIDIFWLTSGSSWSNDKWVVAKDFFRRFVVQFDYKLNKITIYSNTEMKIDTKSNKSIKIIKLNFFLLLCGNILNGIQIYLILSNFCY